MTVGDGAVAGEAPAAEELREHRVEKRAPKAPGDRARAARRGED